MGDDWFVSGPVKNVTGDGSLGNPWRGFGRVQWNSIKDGDTLWVLGDWAPSGYSNEDSVLNDATCSNVWLLNSTKNITIRGDWTTPWATVRAMNRWLANVSSTGVNGVYRAKKLSWISNEPSNIHMAYEYHDNQLKLLASGMRFLPPGPYIYDLTSSNIDIPNSKILVDNPPPDNARVVFVRATEWSCVLPFNQRLYVVNSGSGGFQVSTSRGGTPITFSGSFYMFTGVVIWVEFSSSDVDVDNDEITVAGNYSVDDAVIFDNEEGSLPGGLSKNTRYYIVNVSSGKIKVSTSKGGSAVNLTSGGSGRHLIGMEPPDEILEMFTTGMHVSTGCPSHYQYFKPYGTPSWIVNARMQMPLLKAENSSNITLKNITLESGGFSIKNCHNVTMENVTVRYADYALFGEGGFTYRNVTVRNCTAQRCVNGFYLYGPAENYIVENCIIEDCDNSYIAGAPDMEPIAAGLAFGNCRFSGNTIRRSGDGIVLYWQGQVHNEDIHIEVYNNLVEDVYGCQHHGYASAFSSGNELVSFFPLFATNFPSTPAFLVGKTIKNLTTGAYGTITEVKRTWFIADTAVTSMSGGTRTTWEPGDEFVVDWYNSIGTRAAFNFNGQFNKSADYDAVVKVYNNVVKRCNRAMFVWYKADEAYKIPSVEIYNNTFYMVRAGIMPIGISGGTNKMGNLKCKNNIIYMDVRDSCNSPYFYMMPNAVFESLPFEMNNNLYYTTDGNPSGSHWYIDAVKNRSDFLTALRALVPGADGDAVLDDPAITESTGKIGASSPCRRAGAYAVAATVDDDYFGNPRFNESGGCCIGAHECWDEETTIIGERP